MINTGNIIKILENFAPPDLAESWDNSGWQINLGKTEVKNIMICLSVTRFVLKQAIENNCDLIISHHPLFFSEFKKISQNTISQKLLVTAIQNGIQIYCAHTNLDKTKGGINDILCEKLGLVPQKTVENYVKICDLEEAISLDDFILRLKISLNAQKVKVINPNNIQKVRHIALCSGSGSEFISELKNTDVFVTGDIKYHTALEVDNMVLIDAGHFETEKIILETLKNLLITETPNIIVAKEPNPWIIC